MRPPLSYVPLLPILIGYIAGIISGLYTTDLLWCLSPILFAVLLYISKHKVYAIVCAAIALGWFNTAINAPQQPPLSLIDKNINYTATVLSINESETSRHISVEIKTANNARLTPFKCSLTTPSYNPPVEAGDNITFLGAISPLSFQTDLPDERISAPYLSRQGITATAFVAPENLKVTGREESLLWHIKRLRTTVTQLIASSRLSTETIEFLNATITGDDSMMTTETRLDFTASGLAHVLALSGLHVGIIAIIILIALFPLYIAGMNKTRYIITIILLWIYAIMTGLSPSVTRAVIMATVYMVSLILQRHHSSMNAMCCAAIVILVFSPYSLFQASFQLSFAAVASIFLFAGRLNPVNPRHKIAYNITSYATVSLSAMIGTGIVAAYYFHQIPTYFLLANTLVAFLLPFILGGGALIIFSQAIGIETTWLCVAIDWLYNTALYIAQFVADLPGAVIDNIYFQAWMLIPYFAIVGCVFAAIIYKRREYYIATIILLLSTITISQLINPTYPQSEVFIPRDTNYTNVIYRNGNSAFLITTAHKADHQSVYDRCLSRYNDYFKLRGVDSLVLVPEQYYSPNLSRNGRIVVIDNHAIIIVDNEKEVSRSKLKPDYALVCRGFTGDIINLYNVISPDTILLSKDLNIRRLKRYAKELAAQSIPFKSLRDQAHHSILSP